MAQSDAVEARTLLDLRLGAAFTRMQSLSLQASIGELDGTLVSYGKRVVRNNILPSHYIVHLRAVPIPHSWIRRLALRASQIFRPGTVLVYLPNTHDKRAQRR